MLSKGSDRTATGHRQRAEDDRRGFEVTQGDHAAPQIGQSVEEEEERRDAEPAGRFLWGGLRPRQLS